MTKAERKGRMPPTSERLLRIGGVLMAVASLLHVGIILGGAAWYRFFGAGEQMARMAERGSGYPALVTTPIALLLALAALYAFSAAGVVRPLPLLRLALSVIAGVLLLRGILGVPVVLLVDAPYANELKARMPLMIASSIACVVIGLCYAAGAATVDRRPAR